MAEMMSPDQLKCLRCLLQRGLLFAFLLSLAPVLAQPKAFASLQPERIETGDTAGLLILVTGLNTSPKEVDFSPWASMFPPSNVIARSDWRRSGAQWTRRFTLIAFDSATLELPALNVRLATGNPLETNPVTLTVFPTRGGRDITDMAKIRDIHREPESWMDYWHWAALAAVLLFVCLWWVRKNKLKPPTATVQAPPVAAPVSASELALQKLAQLEQKALWKTGQTKAHCAELSLIVREYLELRYNIASLESTTNEIQAMLKTTDFPATLRTVLSELLQMTDLVKYAQSQPAETIQEAMLAKARTLVSPAHVRDEKPKQRENAPFKTKNREIRTLVARPIQAPSKVGTSINPYTNQQKMTFAQPLWLLLLLLLPILMVQYRRDARQRHVTLQVSRLTAMKGLKTWVVYARNWIQYLRWLVMALVIVAMARPQLLWHEEQIEAESIDIMLVMDVSPSMLSKDFQPDRLTVAKEMAASFVGRRPYDQLGLVVFSGGAFTQCPLTNDRRILQAFINNLQVGRLPDGTAIGMGLATAVRHLDKSTSRSKVVLLITDGENNAGDLGPLTAASAAKALGVRVYTIGIGNDGVVMSPTYQNANGSFAFAARKMSFDTRLLEQVASIANGKFYRARSTADLESIYDEVESLEKTKVLKTSVRRTTELFFWFLNAAFCLLLLEMSLRWGPLRVITV